MMQKHRKILWDLMWRPRAVGSSQQESFNLCHNDTPSVTNTTGSDEEEDPDLDNGNLESMLENTGNAADEELTFHDCCPRNLEEPTLMLRDTEGVSMEEHKYPDLLVREGDKPTMAKNIEANSEEGQVISHCVGAEKLKLTSGAAAPTEAEVLIYPYCLRVSTEEPRFDYKDDDTEDENDSMDYNEFTEGGNANKTNDPPADDVVNNISERLLEFLAKVFILRANVPQSIVYCCKRFKNVLKKLSPEFFEREGAEKVLSQFLARHCDVFDAYQTIQGDTEVKLVESYYKEHKLTFIEPSKEAVQREHVSPVTSETLHDNEHSSDVPRECERVKTINNGVTLTREQKQLKNLVCDHLRLCHMNRCEVGSLHQQMNRFVGEHFHGLRVQGRRFKWKTFLTLCSDVVLVWNGVVILKSTGKAETSSFDPCPSDGESTQRQQNHLNHEQNQLKGLVCYYLQKCEMKSCGVVLLRKQVSEFLKDNPSGLRVPGKRKFLTFLELCNDVLLINNGIAILKDTKLGIATVAGVEGSNSDSSRKLLGAINERTSALACSRQSKIKCDGTAEDKESCLQSPQNVSQPGNDSSLKCLDTNFGKSPAKRISAPDNLSALERKLRKEICCILKEKGPVLLSQLANTLNPIVKVQKEQGKKFKWKEFVEDKCSDIVCVYGKNQQVKLSKNASCSLDTQQEALPKVTLAVSNQALVQSKPPATKDTLNRRDAGLRDVITNVTKEGNCLQSPQNNREPVNDSSLTYSEAVSEKSAGKTMPAPVKLSPLERKLRKEICSILKEKGPVLLSQLANTLNPIVKVQKKQGKKFKWKEFVEDKCSDIVCVYGKNQQVKLSKNASCSLDTQQGALPKVTLAFSNQSLVQSKPPATTDTLNRRDAGLRDVITNVTKEGNCLQSPQNNREPVNDPSLTYSEAISGKSTGRTMPAPEKLSPLERKLRKEICCILKEKGPVLLSQLATTLNPIVKVQKEQGGKNFKWKTFVEDKCSDILCLYGNNQKVKLSKNASSSLDTQQGDLPKVTLAVSNQALVQSKLPATTDTLNRRDAGLRDVITNVTKEGNCLQSPQNNREPVNDSSLTYSEAVSEKSAGKTMPAPVKLSPLERKLRKEICCILKEKGPVLLSQLANTLNPIVKVQQEQGGKKFKWKEFVEDKCSDILCLYGNNQKVKLSKNASSSLDTQQGDLPKVTLAVSNQALVQSKLPATTDTLNRRDAGLRDVITNVTKEGNCLQSPQNNREPVNDSSLTYSEAVSEKSAGKTMPAPVKLSPLERKLRKEICCILKEKGPVLLSQLANTLNPIVKVQKKQDKKFKWKEFVEDKCSDILCLYGKNQQVKLSQNTSSSLNTQQEALPKVTLAVSNKALVQPKLPATSDTLNRLDSGLRDAITLFLHNEPGEHSMREIQSNEEIIKARTQLQNMLTPYGEPFSWKTFLARNVHHFELKNLDVELPVCRARISLRPLTAACKETSAHGSVSADSTKFEQSGKLYGHLNGDGMVLGYETAPIAVSSRSVAIASDVLAAERVGKISKDTGVSTEERCEPTVAKSENFHPLEMVLRTEVSIILEQRNEPVLAHDITNESGVNQLMKALKETRPDGVKYKWSNFLRKCSDVICVTQRTVINEKTNKSTTFDYLSLREDRTQSILDSLDSVLRDAIILFLRHKSKKELPCAMQEVQRYEGVTLARLELQNSLRLYRQVFNWREFLSRNCKYFELKNFSPSVPLLFARISLPTQSQRSSHNMTDQYCQQTAGSSCDQLPSIELTQSEQTLVSEILCRLRKANRTPLSMIASSVGVNRAVAALEKDLNKHGRRFDWIAFLSLAEMVTPLVVTGLDSEDVTQILLSSVGEVHC